MFGSMCVFVFHVAATSEIYTLSLHDALPICRVARGASRRGRRCCAPRVAPGSAARDGGPDARPDPGADRKSTRLNSSHVSISYAVFCLKKKKLNTKREWLPLQQQSTAAAS